MSSKPHNEGSGLALMAQALRRGHCSRGEEDHACVGKCTITQTGIELDCTLCGKGEHEIARDVASFAGAKLHAIRILDAAGVEYDKLSAETQRDVLREVVRNRCPSCGFLILPDSSWSEVYCPCGEFSFDPRSGFRATHKRLERIKELAASFGINEHQARKLIEAKEGH